LRLKSATRLGNLTLPVIVQPGAPMAQIAEMAKLAGAHDFILELPEAYDTPVGEWPMPSYRPRLQVKALEREFPMRCHLSAGFHR
jgi:hypothetical protein